jgi:transposase
MVNQLGMEKSLAIKQLRAQGLSQREIVKALGVSRGAVIRHTRPEDSNSTKAPTGSGEILESSNGTKAPTGSEGQDSSLKESHLEVTGPGRRSLCQPFVEEILSKLEDGLDSQRIHQDLVNEHGFKGKYWSVVRFVRNLNKSTPLPFRRLEVEPGWELQVDFGTGRPCADHTGQIRKAYIFRAVLSHSRKGYTEAVTRLTTESFISVLENAFWRLGGVPKTVVFDNAKCAVIKADWYDPELHPKIIEFCKHYGISFLPTRPATPRHKGKVERGVAYAQNAIKGRQFSSLAEQNEFLSHWEKTVADTRIHGTTKQQVLEAFEKNERGQLGPLPAERFPYYQESQRRVCRDGHIAVGRAYYSVSPEFIGCDVWVRWNSKTVKILNQRLEPIAIHCTVEPGRFSTNSQHIDPRKTHSIERGVEYLLQKVRFLGNDATRWAEDTLEARGIEAARTIQGLLSLCRKYESSQINRACQSAWRSKCYSYRAIKNLLEREATSHQQTMEFMDDHPVIRSITEYGEFVKRAIHGG